jgi:hypothetical protein
MPDQPVTDRSAHWAAAWLARLEALDLDVERWPEGADPTDGRPMKVFIDGRVALRLRADDGALTIDFLTGAKPTPLGCTKRGSGWQATFALDDAPGEGLQSSWLKLLADFGQPRKPVHEEPEEDDAYWWVWDSRERLTERVLYDFDRKPFSEQLRKAFGTLTDDEQRLLRAQWERDLQEEGPTVAEALGWSGKQVMDVYRSAMAKMRAAANRYERPRRPRR